MPETLPNHELKTTESQTMRARQRKFVIEVRSNRRQTRKQPESIWGGIDLKAIVREAEGEAPELFRADACTDRSAEGQCDPLMGPTKANEAIEVVEVVEATPARPVLESSEPSPIPRFVTPENQASPLTRKAGRGPRAKQEANEAAKFPLRSNWEKGSTAENVAAPEDDTGEVSNEALAVLEAENRRLRRLLAARLKQENLTLASMLRKVDLRKS